MRKISLLLIVFAICRTGSAEAELVSFAFEGVVTNVNPAQGDMFDTSQVLSGSYTFESTSSGFPTALGYVGYDTIVAATVTLGPFTGTFSPGYGGTLFGGSGLILVGNDTYGGSDVYGVDIGLVGTDVLGVPAFEFFFELVDPTAMVFNSAELLTSPPALSSFSSTSFYLGGPAVSLPEEAVGYIALGNLTSLSVTPVPIPSTAFLLGSAVVAFSGWRLWRARASRVYQTPA
jgi:hypothetical protein